MIFMVTLWTPNHKAVDMAKIYLKQPREIPGVKKWRVYNTTGGLDGAKQYHVIYTEKGKGEETLQAIIKYFVPFSNEIEGFHFHIEPCIGVSDTYKLFGMKW
jgi:hypothetical protein